MKTALFYLLFSLGTIWAGLALWVQFPQARLLALLALAVMTIAVLVTQLTSQWGWLALVLAAAVIAAWYLSLKPAQDRDWAPDVAHIVRGKIEGETVYLENIRDFRWSSPDQAEEAWTSRVVDLSKITGADMITSVWDNPKIAHLLVSFRFEDQPPLTFSVEIRRERGEKFAVLGGFFRQFELSLIAATEADIVHWRAVARGEDVRLYPLALTPRQLREVFLGYVALGNELNEKPEWYHTVTANCATVVWRLAKVLGPEIPVDRSLIAPGLLPEFLQRLNGLAWSGEMADLRARAEISTIARGWDGTGDFSAFIREGQNP